MTAATLPVWTRLWPRAAPLAETRTAPTQPRGGGPVFIHDAITPVRGETLLGVMLRRDLASREPAHAAERPGSD